MKTKQEKGSFTTSPELSSPKVDVQQVGEHPHLATNPFGASLAVIPFLGCTSSACCWELSHLTASTALLVAASPCMGWELPIFKQVWLGPLQLGFGCGRGKQVPLAAPPILVVSKGGQDGGEEEPVSGIQASACAGEYLGLPGTNPRMSPGKGEMAAAVPHQRHLASPLALLGVPRSSVGCAALQALMGAVAGGRNLGWA